MVREIINFWKIKELTVGIFQFCLVTLSSFGLSQIHHSHYLSNSLSMNCGIETLPLLSNVVHSANGDYHDFSFRCLFVNITDLLQCTINYANLSYQNHNQTILSSRTYKCDNFDQLDYKVYTKNDCLQWYSGV